VQATMTTEYTCDFAGHRGFVKTVSLVLRGRAKWMIGGIGIDVGQDSLRFDHSHLGETNVACGRVVAGVDSSTPRMRPRV